jgi:hypothetical protein
MNFKGNKEDHTPGIVKESLLLLLDFYRDTEEILEIEAILFQIYRTCLHLRSVYEYNVLSLYHILTRKIYIKITV